MRVAASVYTLLVSHRNTSLSQEELYYVLLNAWGKKTDAEVGSNAFCTYMLSFLEHAPPVSRDILIHWWQRKKKELPGRKWGERVDESILCPSISQLIPWPSSHKSIKATMTEDTVHPDKVWEDRTKRGGYTEKPSWFIYNGLRQLKPMLFNKDHYLLSKQKNYHWNISCRRKSRFHFNRRHTAVRTRRPDIKQTWPARGMSLQAKMALLISDSPLIKPRWRGLNSFGLWTFVSSPRIRSDSTEKHKIFTERKRSD